MSKYSADSTKCETKIWKEKNQAGFIDLEADMQRKTYLTCENI